MGLAAAAVTGAAAVGLRAERARHERGVAALWDELARPGDGAVFAPSMTDGLPAPARRYLRRAIAPGTPLARSVELRMHGSLRLAREAEPLPMRAEQVLAPPGGMVWRAAVGRGAMRMVGFDRYGRGAGEMRWWLLGLVPVVRAGGADVSRSAAGRVGLEACLVPSALLPGAGARWEEVDDTTARVRLRVGGETVDFTVEVDPDGRLRRVSGMRWNGDPRNGPVGYLRFDVDRFGDERAFGGYTIPTRLRAGWRLGEPGEFPFFESVIDEAVFR